MDYQTVELIKGPHLLYVGGNGLKTYGISVRILDAHRESASVEGKQLEYDINDYMIANYDLRHLGLEDDEIVALKEEMALMVEEQK